MAGDNKTHFNKKLHLLRLDYEILLVTLLTRVRRQQQQEKFALHQYLRQQDSERFEFHPEDGYEVNPQTQEKPIFAVDLPVNAETISLEELQKELTPLMEELLEMILLEVNVLIPEQQRDLAKDLFTETVATHEPLEFLADAYFHQEQLERMAHLSPAEHEKHFAAQAEQMGIAAELQPHYLESVQQAKQIFEQALSKPKFEQEHQLDFVRAATQSMLVCRMLGLMSRRCDYYRAMDEHVPLLSNIIGNHTSEFVQRTRTISLSQVSGNGMSSFNGELNGIDLLARAGLGSLLAEQGIYSPRDPVVRMRCRPAFTSRQNVEDEERRLNFNQI